MASEQKYQKLLVKVARNVKRAREAKGLTQEDMAGHGFNYRHYQRIESGKHSFNLYTLYRLSAVFRVDVSAFFR